MNCHGIKASGPRPENRLGYEAAFLTHRMYSADGISTPKVSLTSDEPETIGSYRHLEADKGE